jgi:hypothetical protein
MRIGVTFALGVAAGGIVGWLWGREIEESVGKKGRELRAKAAGGVRAVGETTEKMLDRGEAALRRAGELVHDTKEHASEALGAAPDTSRPAPTAGNA